MDLPALKLLAWQGPFPPCGTCGQTGGHRCRTATSGALTAPHKPRLDAARGWVARQPEVDALTTDRDNLIKALEASEDAREDALQDGAEWARLLGEEKDRVTDLNATIVGLRKDAATDAATVTRLKREVADLTATVGQRDATIRDQAERIEELENPEPVRTTIFGSCPASPGGTSIAAAQTVIDKWGKGAAVRIFLATTPAPRPPDASVVHASWNLDLTPAMLTDAWATKAFANLRKGDRVEHIHEGDKKVTDGKATYEEVVARKNAFHDVAKRVRPDLLVVNTLTGGSLADYGGTREDRWGAVKADILGVDCDGVHDKTPPLNIDYRDELVSAVAFVKKYAANGYTGIDVPEFGTSRPPFDSDGTIRAAWAKVQAAIFVEFGVGVVNLYDYESTPGNEFVPGSPEFDVWRALVGSQ